ncbi:MAG: glycosyltransferase [bacterium]|nr:glycosyltransferase [bacterium]
MKPTISIIIPALNEENNIKPTIEEVLSGIGDKFTDYEILIFDDGSSDKTGIIADELAVKNPKIKVIHNIKTKGLGYNYKEGVTLAKNDYIVWFPGDNGLSVESIEKVMNKVGEADIIIPYTLNTWVRPLSRRIISKVFVWGINLLFNIKVKYYNGTVVFKRELIQSISISTNSFAFQSEALVKLLKKGYNYVEVGYNVKERQYGKSKAFQLKNIINVFKTIINLFWQIYIKRGETKGDTNGS